MVVFFLILKCRHKGRQVSGEESVAMFMFKLPVDIGYIISHREPFLAVSANRGEEIMEMPGLNKIVA
jgi:hypothetical protein